MEKDDRVFHAKFGAGTFQGFVRAGSRDKRYAKVLFDRDQEVHRVMETTLRPARTPSPAMTGPGVKLTMELLGDIRFLVHPDHHKSNRDRADKTFKAVNEIIETLRRRRREEQKRGNRK